MEQWGVGVFGAGTARWLASEPLRSLAGLSCLWAVPAGQPGVSKGLVCSFVHHRRSQRSLDSPTSHLSLNGWTQPICPKSVWPHRALQLPQSKSPCPLYPQGCVTAVAQERMGMKLLSGAPEPFLVT